MWSSYPESREEIHITNARLRKLWLPPSDLTIRQWAEAHHTLPPSSGRPGPFVADPIQRDILDACCDPSVDEVVFMKATRLGWSEICNVALGWGIQLHGMSMLMLQPSRDMAEKYCKERLDEMIMRNKWLSDNLRVSTSKAAGSTTRYKRFRNGGSFFVASAGNPRELRATKSRFTIQDEADGYQNDVSDEGDPDKLVRRRGDEFHDFRMLIGSTPGMPQGVSRIERAYLKSSMGIYNVPCPHCGAMEPLLWRDPETGEYLLKFEKDDHKQVIPESVHWTCIRCGAAIYEREKVAMLEKGAWHHRRAVAKVKGFWANGLYAMFPNHWTKLAQEWLDSQGDTMALKAFINLNLAETFQEPGESVEADLLRKRAENNKRPRAQVPDGAALLIVSCDVQGNRLEAQAVAFMPDERAFLVDSQIFPGNPLEAATWEDLDAWLLRGWRHEKGQTIQPHLVLVDARDGNTKDAVFQFCQARANRWIFPQFGVERLASKGWAEEGSAKKNAVRSFISATDDLKQVLLARLQLDPAAPRSIHLPDWVSDEYLDQLASEKRLAVTDPKTRKTTYRWVKTRPRNEALDLWVYVMSGYWIITRILAPHLGGINGKDHLQAIAQANSKPAEGSPVYASGPAKRIRSNGIWR